MNKKKRILSVCLCVSILAAGCKAPANEEIIVQTEKANDEVSYKLVDVMRGDVELTRLMECTYRETKSQKVTFPASGKLVDKVYVRAGDRVKKGDLLVELSAAGLEEQIATYEYNIKRNELLLGYLDTNEEIDRQARYVTYMQFGGDKEKLEEDLANISKGYDAQRTTYNDNLEFDRAKLAKLKGELKDSRVYADFDGTVTKVKSDLVGSTSRIEEEVITIVDNSDCLFETKEEEYSKYYKEGVPVTMSIAVGDAKGSYELLPYHMDEWGETQLFEVSVMPEDAALEVGVYGRLTLPIDKRENVLCIPKDVVYTADDKAFVYVLNKDNFREIRWIEVGLWGDSMVEVLSGLSEGEKVVKR